MLAHAAISAVVGGSSPSLAISYSTSSVYIKNPEFKNKILTLSQQALAVMNLLETFMAP